MSRNTGASAALPQPAIGVDLILDARAYLGECPVWNHRSGRLDWVDVMSGRLHSTDVATGQTTTLCLPLATGCFVPRAGGGYVAGLADGFWAVGQDGSAQRLVGVEAERPETFFNDGRCDPAGRFWAGTMAYDLRESAGSLYRLDTDLTVHRMLSGVTISNGIDWSLDGRTMYYVDTATQRIDVFDYDAATGSIQHRRPFVVIDAADGSPDGLVVDAEGAIWVALWDGWAVRRYLPDGTLDRVVRVPTAKVTSIAFGGADLDQLYITTARRLADETDRARQPLAGGIFRAEVGIRGRRAVAFAG